MPYPCNDCSFIGVTERALKVHTQREHSGDAPKPVATRATEKPDIASQLGMPRTDEKLMSEVAPVVLKDEPIATERLANGTDLIPPQPDPFLVIRRRVYRELQRVEARRKYHPVNVFLLGPQGQGKTSLARQFAARTNSPLAEVQCGLLSESSQFFGQLKFTPEVGTFYQETQLVKAIETPGCVIILDELNRVDNPKVINSLFWLLDDRREAWLDDLGRYIRVASGVVFFATLNEGVIFSGIDFVDAALRDRFTAIKMDYPSFDKERDILMTKGRMEKVQQAHVNGFVPMTKTEVPVEQAELLVNIANEIRGNVAFDHKVSTRQLIIAMEELSFGATILEAIEFAFGNHYDQDLAEDIYKTPQLHMTEEAVRTRIKDPEIVF